jgi:crotonobetainyl-CoA:carnitine CoA-transferase CaiB-like acyl-CoA transferase
VLAGPLSTMNLSDLGAEVIKVERPGTGDETRTWGPPEWDDGTGHVEATYYLAINRDKKSVALDLTDADATLGLDYDTVAAENPGVVYCTISAFGSEGAAKGIPGYDLLAQAMSGIMHMTGAPDGPPTRAGIPVADVMTGLYATIGITAALTERERTGHGRHVEVSLFDSAMGALINHGTAVMLGGASPMRDLNRHYSIAPYAAYRAADAVLIICAANDKLFGLVCEAIGRADLVDHPDFATNAMRRANDDRLTEEIEQALAAATAAEWVERFRAAGVPAGPVNSVAEAIDWAREMGLEPTVEDPGSGYRAIRSPIRVDGQVPAECERPPAIDEHGDEIRSRFAP